MSRLYDQYIYEQEEPGEHPQRGTGSEGIGTPEWMQCLREDYNINWQQAEEADKLRGERLGIGKEV